MQNSDVLDLNGRQLGLFLAILDERTMPGACRRQSLEPEDAAASIDQMRRILKDDLFIRTGRSLEPTSFALQIEEEIREYLARLESLAAPREFRPEEETGRITLAANVTEMLDEIKEMRDVLREEAPSASLRFLELGSRDNIEPMLSSGEVDIVITVSLREYASSLNGNAFSADKHVVFYDPACRPPIHSIEEYADADHATLDFGRGGSSTIDDILRRESLNRRIVLSAPDVMALGVLMKGTRLIATLQSRLARTVFSHLAYCEPPIYLPTQKFDLVWHRRDDNSAKSRWLRKVIMGVAESSSFAREERASGW